ncbi:MULTISPECIES: nucleotide sugar dehydrogenase [unclassified Sporosarcina]|uniref:nucleotide sugar dehydrogenase n=1 Tax=unclassified Sporosarcina TaxID=2647733 RepID=UPI000C16C37F|nr:MULTISPECIES: nucleotide sugar dehydrogenase [unclassified Sporosarcina]PID05915.1 UDP-N-acetyl-D-mannosamine dehydrogenase [Sporosarcina sp. P30]PID09109.1 UDP-N-acetyl-D-mannosamine dehydrogenase [Sporosarcina sp. P31]PID12406.1 UDP-N-acetyl-D-mannosamine dehydrogenase [Sporosarcina sp. P32b]
MEKKLCVVGLGYIGLPTAVMFANSGLQVHGVDRNERVVNLINNKQLHIEENGLQERLEKAVDAGHFQASTTPVEADVYIIAVPSPINPDNTANLEFIRAATASIVPFVKKGALVILESTVPPKTVENIMLPELRKTDLIIGEELFVSHSPERVIPGKIFEELVNNDRIVGGINAKSAEMTKDLYEVFVKGTIHLTDATTAELVKVMENTYRDVNIAFANELAKIAEGIDVDIWEAIKFANFHPRVNIHTPGPGVGGHCIAVDPWFLVELAPEKADIIKKARLTNDGMPMYTAKRAQRLLQEYNIENGKVAVLGLAFKGNVDDMRESPSTKVIDSLLELGLDVVSFDPHIKELQHSTQVATLEEAIGTADLLLLTTDHDQFKELNPAELQTKQPRPIMLDTKNALQADKWEQAEYRFFKLGDGKKEGQLYK